MKRTTMLAALGALLIVAVTAAVAMAATGHRAAALPVLQVSEVNKTVTVSGTPQSGATEVDFTTDLPAKHGNTGTTLGMILLKNGVTVDQFAAGIKPDGSNLDQFGALLTTVDLSKGQTVKVQTLLHPGNYVIADLNAPPSSGLHTTMAVSQAASPLALPAAKATVKLKNYRFVGPSTLKRGTMVRTENVGTQQHMAILIKVKNMKSAKAVVKFLRKGKDKQAQKLARGIGNLTDDVSPGAINQGILDAQKGVYVLACFMTNSKGVEHTRLGMEKIVKVK